MKVLNCVLGMRVSRPNGLRWTPPPPEVTFTSPLNNTYATSTIAAYATNTTTVHTAWWRYLNGSRSANQTLKWDGADSRWEAEDLTWLDGSYQVQVFFNDCIGNEALAVQYFTVDTTPPAEITDLAASNPTAEPRRFLLSRPFA